LTHATRFARFWWDFVVGDDWTVAAGIAAALASTAVLAHYGVAAWWLMPVAVLVLLGRSIRRGTATRSESRTAR
jgi:hypothetical protein